MGKMTTAERVARFKGKRINPEKSFYMLQGAEPLMCWVREAKIITSKQNGKQRKLYTVVVLEPSVNGQNSKGLGGQTFKVGEQVLLSETAALGELDRYIQESQALCIIPTEKIPVGNGTQSFWRIEIFARELTKDELIVVREYHYSHDPVTGEVK